MMMIPPLTKRPEYSAQSCAACGSRFSAVDWVIVDTGATICLSDDCRRQHIRDFKQMVDATEQEKTAMYACFGPLGEYAASIGDKPFFSYTKEEIGGMIETIVSTYGISLANQQSGG